MRHGYFLPLQNLMCGDLAFATESREIYIALGFSKACDHSNCKLGEECPGRYYKYAGHYEGVSIFERDDGSLVKRICLRNYFHPEFKHVVQDV